MSIQSQIDALKAELAKGNSASSSSNVSSSNTSSTNSDVKVSSTQNQSVPKNALLSEDGDFFTKTEDEDTDNIQNEYSKSLQSIDDYKQMASLLVQSNNI